MSDPAKSLGCRARAVVWVRRVVGALVFLSFAALFAGLEWRVVSWLAPLAKAQYATAILAGNIVVAAVVTAVTILCGRLYCSVLCPLGLLQDLANLPGRLVSRLLRRPPPPVGPAARRAQFAVRHVALAAFLAAGLCGLGFSWVEPYGIFGRATVLWSGVALVAVIAALALIGRGRAWCNWVCPVGTLLGLFSRVAPFRLRIDGSRCVGCRKCRPVYRKTLQDFLRPNYDCLCDTCKSRFEKNPMRILDCKSQEDQDLCKDAPMMIDYLCDECKQDLEDVKRYLDDMGIKYIVDPSIVRGLDYYTKTAFEFIGTGIGTQGTVCGGGRYDHLIEEIGGPDMPGVGFGLGKERLIMLMENAGETFGGEEKLQLFLTWIGDEAKDYAVTLLHELRGQGVRADMDSRERNLKGQMKYANKLGAQYTVVIGDDEVKSGDLTLKNMETGEQTKVRREELVNAL